jgi:flagellar motor protein MotB
MQTAQFPSNWDLSTARVASAVLALSEVYEVPAEHLSASALPNTNRLPTI